MPTDTLRHAALAALAALMLFVLPAAASTFIITEDELDPHLFPAVANSIRVNLDQVGLSAARQAQVLRLLERMEAHLAEDPRRHHSRIRQNQRRLNAAMAPELTPKELRAEVVCEQVRPVGSHIPKTRCRNREEIEDEHYAAMRVVTDPPLCRGTSAGGCL